VVNRAVNIFDLAAAPTDFYASFARTFFYALAFSGERHGSKASNLSPILTC